jgi:hypothetical protein
MQNITTNNNLNSTPLNIKIMKKEIVLIVFLIALPLMGFGQSGIGAGVPFLGLGRTFYGLNVGTADYGSSYFGERAGGSGGYSCTIIGSSAGSSNLGSSNTFVGSMSGNSNTSGFSNLFMGYAAGLSNYSGSNNVFSGNQAGYQNTTGSNNVFTGNQAGYRSYYGSGNVYIGNQSGYNITNMGIENVFIGNQSGKNITGSAYNTFVGSYAGYNAVGTYNVFLGSSAGYSETGSNRLYIDNSSTPIPLIYGKFDTDQVGINTTNIPFGYVFAVKGKVITEEVNVALQGSTVWPDYVFTNAYNLPSLKEVEKHIMEKGHLQNIPSAKDVAENGLLLGDINVKLLQKIEELTLYSIQQQKELEAQQEKNNTLETRLKKIEELLSYSHK